MTARDVAERLGVDRRDVVRCLAYELAGKVRQAGDYTWWPKESARTATAEPWPAVAEPAPAVAGPSPGVEAPRAPTANTEIARLCRYYLECIGQDMDEGASAFAANRYGEPDYAELPSLPIADAAEDWFNALGVSRVLGKVRSERGRLMAWLGYPVRLRRHQTARWEGFFVEPVLLWRIELGERAGEPPRIEDRRHSRACTGLQAVAARAVEVIRGRVARVAE